MFARLCIVLSLVLAADLTLDNGIRISTPASDGASFTLLLGYKAGIRNETHSFSGMAAVVDHYLQSTAAARSLALAAYGAGGSVEFREDPDLTAIRISVPPWAAPMVLSPAAAFLADTPDRNPNLMERAIATSIASAPEGASEFREGIENEIRMSLLGSHPYTHPLNGRKADLEQITPDDVTRFFTENYGTDRGFVLLTSPLNDDIRRSLSAVPARQSRKLPEVPLHTMAANRTLRFAPGESTGAVVFAVPVPGVFYREWYATLILDRIIRRTFREKTSTALRLTVDPYYWRVEVPVPAGQLAEPVEDSLLQNINRLQFTRTKPEDLEAARRDAESYLDSPSVRDWFAAEGLESRRQEGLQWIQSFTADDVRTTVRDSVATNHVVASWSPRPKQNSVQVESLSSATGNTTPKSAAPMMPLNPVTVAPFPPHEHAAKAYSTPERLASGVWLASSSIYGVFVSGSDDSGQPDGAFRTGPNGTLWNRNDISDVNVFKTFQKYRADRILVLARPADLETARKLWNTFKSNDRDATVITPKGNVANIDIPALIVLKSMLDRKLIESGWWNDASLHIDATLGATLEIEAPAPIRAQITEWIKGIAGTPASEQDFTWAREATIHHLNDVLPDAQILVWQRVHDYILPDLETIAPSQVQDVAKLYF